MGLHLAQDQVIHLWELRGGFQSWSEVRGPQDNVWSCGWKSALNKDLGFSSVLWNTARVLSAGSEAKNKILEVELVQLQSGGGASFQF